MGQPQQKRRAVLIVEDDAELRSLTAALCLRTNVCVIDARDQDCARPPPGPVGL